MSSVEYGTISKSITCVVLLLVYIPAVQLTVDTYQPDLKQLEFVAIVSLISYQNILKSHRIQITGSFIGMEIGLHLKHTEMIRI